ncbi:MAG: hypothetical protein KDA90_15235, partial [Planctomycetaceae bacterium]|nr:hypothetical protein [Planctomycetaceae bacterium]
MPSEVFGHHGEVGDAQWFEQKLNPNQKHATQYTENAYVSRTNRVRQVSLAPRGPLALGVLLPSCIKQPHHTEVGNTTMNTLNALLNDEAGFIVSAELVLVA